MTLTEEQRAALKRVVAYMDEMYAIASPYYGCTEDANILRAMIDGSGTVEPAGGFDLERARGLRDFLQDDCAEVGDVWAEMIAEIERLRGEMENYGDDYVCQMKSKDARIQELEADNQNLVTLNKSLMNNDWILRDNNRKYRKRAQKAELLNKELKSKIGPDAETGNRDHVVGPDQMVPCWQITEDRVTAIDQGLRFLEWSNAKTGNVETKKRIAILKTMLEEASDEHGFER